VRFRGRTFLRMSLMLFKGSLMEFEQLVKGLPLLICLIIVTDAVKLEV